MTVEFRAWPKTPRLFRQTWITEKIDGTNGAIIVQQTEDGRYDEYSDVPYVALPDGLIVSAQSRKRVVTPSNDNHGFARWVWDNAAELARVLGPGYHYGEWWGRGIQRGYGLNGKRFSLFNTRRWWFDFPDDCAVPELEVVPVLHIGPFSEQSIRSAIYNLRENGSYASVGYKRPEGIVIYHEDANQVFKVLLENDEIPKSLVEVT